MTICINDNIKVHFVVKLYIYIYVGTRFAAQAQNVWNLDPVSLVQEICREWVKELGFCELDNG